MKTESIINSVAVLLASSIIVEAPWGFELSGRGQKVAEKVAQADRILIENYPEQ